MPLMISLSNDTEEFLGEITFLGDIFGLFVTDQAMLDKNLWMLVQRSKGGMTLSDVENLPYWRYEQFVNIANEIADEERKSRESQESNQDFKQANNFNPSSYLSKMSGMANKFKS